MEAETEHQVEQVEALPLPQPKKPRRSSKNKIPTRSKMVTGYIIYASEIRKEIINKHKDLSFGEISKIVGDEWKKLAQETKVAYEKRAQEQNVKFRIEFAALEQQAGLVKLANAAAAQADSALEDNKQKVQQSLHQNQNQNPHPDQPLVNFSSQQQHQQQALAVYHQQQQLLQQQSASANSDLQHIQQSQLRNYNQSPYNIEDLRSIQHHSQQQGEQQQQLQDIMANFQQQQQHSASVTSELHNQTQQFAQSHLHHQSLYHVEDLRSSQHNHQQEQPQQQQPFMQQPQQSFPTMVQYCNNPACCSTNNGRYQPYPYPYSPTRPTTPLSLQQQQSHIVYRKPIVEKNRPKDASTQTDPIKWVEKTENEFTVDDKKPLKFSQKFLDHINSNSSETEGDSNNNISDDASGASITEAASH